MENNEKILCNAKIECRLQKVATVIYYLAIIIVSIFAFDSAKYFNRKEYYWFGWCYGTYNYIDYDWNEQGADFPADDLLFLSLIYLAVIVPPILFYAFSKLIAKNCTLTLTEKQICGQLKTLFGKKQIQIPIEKLDNIMTTSGFMDKFRSGETICVSSNSGMVKFHYVQNADEFVKTALKRIEEIKGIQAQALQNTSAPVQNVSGSDAMEKINSVKQMLDSGLISQAEFEEKKKDILSKM